MKEKCGDCISFVPKKIFNSDGSDFAVGGCALPEVVTPVGKYDTPILVINNKTCFSPRVGVIINS